MERENKTYDLIIIGGGITGAGVLRAASKKGLKTLLLEKNDFASGTSSKSGKLVHGGLRYLQHLQFKIVRESLIERNWLLEAYPHLVKPIEFVFPLYGLKFKYKIAMFLYQIMGKHKNLPKYKFFNKKETIQKYSKINSEGLKGGFSYYDGITNDARLVNEIIFEATQNQEAEAKNYIKVTSITDNKKRCVIKCKDTITNEEYTLYGKVIVNCTGPWSDKTLEKYKPQPKKTMEPSKGVHLVFSKERLPLSSAFAFVSGANDGCLFYALPWENNTVILGPTDTTFSGDYDNLKENENEIQYLLKGLNQFSPNSNFTKKDILYIFVGLRPLFNEDGESKDKTRDFKIWWSSNDIVSISGGKLTTFRAMGKVLIEKVISKKQLTCISVLPLKDPDISIELPKHIKNNYSLLSQGKIEKIILENSVNIEPLVPELKVIKAEIIFAIKELKAKTVEDIMLRRFSFDYGLQQKNYYSKLKVIITDILLYNTNKQ
ncbi:MAG: glycerol-3-phosphate dehydrogenase/oxidase [Flavobacteriaceae bacterium]|nr:glycerol-3-phosphate dehydrogenase/oxidase [Flavobacteriaceae bacterium]